MKNAQIKTKEGSFEFPAASVDKLNNGNLVFYPNVKSEGFRFDETTRIIIPVSLIPAQPGNSMEDRMRLRHACIQMAIQANLDGSDGKRRNIHEVALEFYNFIVK